jgi:hypothetical protein
MKIAQPKNRKKLIIVSLLAILLLGSIGTGTAYLLKVGPFADQINLDKPSDDELKTGSDIKKGSVDQSNDGKQQTGSDPAPDPVPIPSSNMKSVNMDITAANQNGGTLSIRALIQTVVSTGACKLTMTGPSGKTYSSSANVQALPSSATCQGFNVPVSELSPGSWKINLTFTNDTLQAQAIKDIVVE